MLSFNTVMCLVSLLMKATLVSGSESQRASSGLNDTLVGNSKLVSSLLNFFCVLTQRINSEVVDNQP